MLIGIPPILSPELMKVLMEMGHGDEIVLADGNFPASSMGRRLVRADGHPILPLLDAILRFFPLDRFVQKPLLCMSVVPGDKTKPVIWEEFR
ncbi:MAG TPA: RbsD/FucU domain-containing protein, partial [Spirochaetia bacterium]|nr:RbsD/FucU domain-containing protein [Spirochaetia bacterium]